MLARGSAFPVAARDEVSSAERLADEIARIPKEEAAPGEFVERRKFVRRRADRVQGRSLEILGHAIEYLMDSRMFVVEAEAAKAEREAIQILMQSSRAVFSECEEVVTLGDRLRQWWVRRVKRRPAAARPAGGVTRL